MGISILDLDVDVGRCATFLPAVGIRDPGIHAGDDPSLMRIMTCYSSFIPRKILLGNPSLQALLAG